MKSIIALLALVVVASAMTDRESWAYFKNKFGKSYAGVDADNYRFGIFVANLREAEYLQSQTTTALFGITQFMDLTHKEFQARYANLNATSRRQWLNTLPQVHHKVKFSPVDWRGKAVTSVKDQEQCGSCWAFSTAEAMEGCIMLKNGGTIVDVSAQQIVDCCHAGGSAGCNGGWPNQCIQWAVDEDLATWDSYPYNAYDGTCEAVTEIAVPAGTCKFIAIPIDENQLIGALQNGPVSVCIDATALFYYTGGIISGSSCNGNYIDHAILLAAWDGSTYTVKNSWGTLWGEAGYFRAQSGVNCLLITSLSTQALPL